MCIMQMIIIHRILVSAVMTSGYIRIFINSNNALRVN